jgi:hypothetical protein
VGITSKRGGGVDVDVGRLSSMDGPVLGSLPKFGVFLVCRFVGSLLWG